MRVSHLSWAPCAVLRVCFIASSSESGGLFDFDGRLRSSALACLPPRMLHSNPSYGALAFVQS